MILSIGNGIASVDGDILSYDAVPLQQVNQVLVSVIETPDYIRPASADLSSFANYPKIISEPFVVEFPHTVGYVAFALAFNIPLRTRWLISDDDKGDIGGAYTDVYPNLWPAPETKVYNGVTYRVYWTSYATLIKHPVQLWA
jgi:hypothetical protein